MMYIEMCMILYDLYGKLYDLYDSYRNLYDFVGIGFYWIILEFVLCYMMSIGMCI